MDTETNAGIMGGFSLSNLTGAALAAFLIMVGAALLLTGHYMVFRDVAMF